MCCTAGSHSHCPACLIPISRLTVRDGQRQRLNSAIKRKGAISLSSQPAFNSGNPATQTAASLIVLADSLPAQGEGVNERSCEPVVASAHLAPVQWTICSRCLMSLAHWDEPSAFGFQQQQKKRRFLSTCLKDTLQLSSCTQDGFEDELVQG